jgi:hypothetical protein
VSQFDFFGTYGKLNYILCLCINKLGLNMMYIGTDIYHTFRKKSVIRSNKRKNNFTFSIPYNGRVSSVLAMLKQWKQTKLKYERRKSYITDQEYQNSLLKGCVDCPVRVFDASFFNANSKRQLLLAVTCKELLRTESSSSDCSGGFIVYFIFFS